MSGDPRNLLDAFESPNPAARRDHQQYIDTTNKEADRINAESNLRDAQARAASGSPNASPVGPQWNNTQIQRRHGDQANTIRRELARTTIGNLKKLPTYWIKDIFTMGHNLILVEQLREGGADDYSACHQYLLQTNPAIQGLNELRGHTKEELDHATWNDMCMHLLHANYGALWKALLAIPNVTQTNLENFDQFSHRFLEASETCVWGQALESAPPVDWRVQTQAMLATHVNAFRMGAMEPYRTQLTKLMTAHPKKQLDFNFLRSNVAITVDPTTLVTPSDQPPEPAHAAMGGRGYGGGRGSYGYGGGKGSYADSGSGPDNRCYSCGETGHVSYNCERNKGKGTSSWQDNRDWRWDNENTGKGSRGYHGYQRERERDNEHTREQDRDNRKRDRSPKRKRGKSPERAGEKQKGNDGIA